MAKRYNKILTLLIKKENNAVPPFASQPAKNFLKAGKSHYKHSDSN